MLAVLISPTCAVAGSEDLHWSPDFGGPGVDGIVEAAASWKGDLIVGGEFSAAGETSAASIARWDGARWHHLGRGFDGSVRALAVWNGNLYAGGAFTRAGDVEAEGIARWDGTSWHSVGPGLSSAESGVKVTVSALLGREGHLVVGGEFISAGGVSSQNVAAWDGTRWSALGLGLGGEHSRVLALAEYRGDLVAAGSFNTTGDVAVRNVARWDAVGWHPIGNGPAANVHALVEFDDQLFVGGSFREVGGLPIERVARWNGIEWGPAGDLGSIVQAFAVWDDTLYVGGSLRIDGGGRGVARWSGSTWLPVDGGTDGGVDALTIHEQMLIAGGHFSEAGGATAHAIASWDGSWSAFGPTAAGISNRVSSITTYQGSIVVGGSFREAGGVQVGGVARRDGDAWIPLGAGIVGSVDALLEYEGNLVAGGLFSVAGGDSVNSVARWNGSAWQPMSSPNVYSIVELFELDGVLYAAGTFRFPDEGFYTLARWDGTAWVEVAVPEGVHVSTLSSHDGHLLIGGWIPERGEPFSGYVGLRDGAGWQRFGRLNDQVDAVVSYQGRIVAGGEFYWNGDTRSDVARVAAWDGSTWQSLGPASPRTNVIRDVGKLAVWGSDLVAAGSFYEIARSDCRAIAKWDGRKWEPFGSGLSGPFLVDVHALEVQEGSLWVGGNFTRAGGRPSFYLARWDEFLPGTPVLNPVLALQPAYPNPTREAVAVPLVLSADARAHLTVHDVSGRRVATVLDDQLAQGGHTLEWTGLESGGRRAPPGVYFFRLRVAGHERSQRVVVVQ